MSKGGKKQTREQSQTTNQTTQVDPATQRFVTQFMRPLAQSGAGAALGQEGSFFAGPTDAQRQALEQAGADLSGVGDFGFSPSQMDPSRAQDFFSPFQDEVVGSMQQAFDRQRQQAMSQAAQEATGAGAFGGSRSGILQAEALNNVNRNEASQLAQLRNQGFQNAMGMAGQEHQLMQNLGLSSARARQQGALQEAGLGLEQAQQQFGMGEQMRQIEQQQRQEPLFRHQQALQMANLGMGPTLGETTTGQTTGSSTTTTQNQGGLFGNLLGAGLTAAGMFTGAGPLAGLLGGGGGGGGSVAAGTLEPFDPTAGLPILRRRF